MNTPYNYTTPNWAPLERAIKAAGLIPATAGEFMWMQEATPGVHSFKHRDTRSYAVLSINMDLETAAKRVRQARHCERIWRQ
jgi:hypothetical protein